MRLLKKRLLAVLAGASLLLGACSGQSGQKGLEGMSSSASQEESLAMGRYIEEECALPGGFPIQALHETQPGELECFVSPEDAPQDWGVYRSADLGKSWEKQERPYLQDFFEQQGQNLTSAAFGEDGSLYILFYQDDPELTKRREEKEAKGEQLDFAHDFPQNRLVIFPVQGGMTETELAFEGTDGMAGSELILRPNGEKQLLCASYRMLYQFDEATGEALHIFTCEDQIFNYAVKAGQVFAVVYNEKEIQRFDLSTGEELERLVQPNEMTGSDSVLSASQSEDALLMSERTGLYRYVLGGSLWERVVDGELTSLGLPSLSGRMLIDTVDGSYYILSTQVAGGRRQQMLYRYTYSESVPAVPQGELTVYSLKDNDTVRQAIGQWQRRNPNMRVNYQLGLDEQGAVTRQDAIRALNTALLAGKGPDLLILDGLPRQSYVEKGVLYELSSFLEPKLQKGELLENMANACRQEGKIYAVPARFGVPQLWVSEEGGTHAGSLSEFAGWLSKQRAENGWIYPDMTPEGLMRVFSVSCIPAWKQADGSLKREPLAAFLEDIRRMSETEPESEQEYISLPEDMPPLSLLGLSFTTGGVLVLPGVSQGFSEAKDACAGIGTMRDGVCLPMPGQAQSLFVPQTVLGVNARSAKQEQALELIEAILSEPVQQMDFEDGYPVNAAAFEKSWHSPYSEIGVAYTFSGETADGQSYELSVSWPDEAFMQRQAGWIRELSVPSEEDTVLLEMLISETKGFFAGEKTAQQAADAVIKRTEAYLSE